jgi:HNH endonuclease
MSAICEVDDCEWVGQLRRGMCNTHYQQFRKSDEFRPLPPRVCSIPDCDRPHYIRGWCLMHHARWVAHGTTDPVSVPTLAERLASNLVLMPSGCLEWQGATSNGGYGEIAVNGRPVGTHRVAWTLVNGTIPDGLHVLHHCDNPPCGQTEPTEDYPDGHLFLGTNADNHADMVAKGRDFATTGAKLWPDTDVITARRRVANGENIPDVAASLGIPLQTVNNWVIGRTRNHVK